MLRRIALVIALVAGAVLPIVVLSPPASAVPITTSNITQPADGTHFFVSDSSPVTDVALVGTTDGAAGTTQVDIRCYERSGRWGLVIGNITVGAGGTFSTTMKTDRPYGNCMLRAVPTGYPNTGDISAFTGPSIVGELSISKTVPSGPNAGKVYDFDAWFQGAHALNEYQSAFGYGLADSRLQFGDVASNYLWYGAASLAGSDGGRALVRVDGRNAYGPKSAWQALPDNSGFLQLTFTAIRDAATGNLTIHETEPLMVCPTDTYPPTAASCPQWKRAGVRLERTYYAYDGGRQVRVTDVWRSTDGKPHTVSAHYDQWVEGADFSSGGYLMTPVGVQLPWVSTTFKTFTNPAVFAGPTSGPRTIFVRDDNGAPDGDAAFPRGAVTFDLPPQKVQRRANDRFTLRNDGIAIPAGGKRIVREILVMGTRQAAVAAKAAANEKRINPYRSDAAIRTSSATKFLGNNVYNTTGTNQTTTAHRHRGATVAFDVKVQNDGTVPDSFRLKGPGGASAFAVRYVAGSRDITDAVEGGTYRLKDLAPGATRTIRLVVTVKSGASIGAVHSWLVTAISTHDGTRKDAVEAGVQVTAG